MTERGRQAIAVLASQGTLSIRELAARLFVSEASARRAVAQLEAEGVVRRVYGGVILASTENAAVPLSVRDGDHSAQKERLARRAAEMVQDGDTIMMDASSTVRRMAKHLLWRKDLTIITNNAAIWDELSPSSIRVYCTGGEYLRSDRALVGPVAENVVRQFWADKLFFSSQGVSLSGEVSDHCEAQTALRRVMIERAQQKICLLDDSKLGRQCRFRLCGPEEIDQYLCEKALPWT